MRKKLVVSFLSITITILLITQVAFAGSLNISSPSKSTNIIGTNEFILNTGNLNNSKAPSSSSRLQRIDSPIISNAILSDDEANSSSEVTIIYSPDLPDSDSNTYECADPNSYIALEMQMVNMVNEARKEADESELIYCDDLSYFARLHSADMAEGHYFSHTSPTNGSYVSRLCSSGINYISSGENLARFADLDKAHKALLKSSGHRQNMLSSKYTHVGIGIVWDEKLEVFCITQWFARFY